MRSERLVVAALALAILAGCADFKRGDYWEIGETGEDETADDGLYAYADVHEVLVAGCERCHAPGNSAGNTKFLLEADNLESSYTNVLEFIDTDSPADSRLLAKGAGNGHGGGTIFDESSAEYDLILAWIEQGAPP